MLTSDDIARLNRARDVCKRLRDQATDAGLKADGPAGALGFGMLAHAAETAGDALFNTLNVARHQTRLPVTDEQLFNKKGAR